MGRAENLPQVSGGLMSEACSIVIPNLNGRQHLERCLPSLLEAIAFDGGAHEIILVDNGSSDGSVAYAQGVGPGVRVIALEHNIGFAAACNRGAAAGRHGLLLFLNNDMYFDRAFLAPLLAPFARHKDLFAVGAQQLNWEGQFLGGRVYGGFVLGAFQPVADRRRYELLCHTLYSSGAVSAIDRTKFEQLGGFDELLYVYEDVDLGYRAWKRGWRVFYEPRSLVYHKGQATARRLFSRHRYLVVNLTNRFWFTWKNMTERAIWRRYLALLPLSLPYLALRQRSPAPFVALWHAWRGRKAILERRRGQAELAVRRDHEVLEFVRDHVYVAEQG